MWEESWDDDDTTEDFSAQLKYVSSNPHFNLAITNNDHREELKKVEASRRT